MVEILVPNIKDLISEKELQQLENLLSTLLTENVILGTNRVAGKLELTATSAEIVKKTLRSFYNSNQYKKSIAKYLINVKNIGENNRSLYSDAGLKIEQSAISNNQKLAISEHLAYLEEAGLNANFNQPLRQIIYSNINAGISQNGLEAKLKEYISGGKDQSGKLSKYVKQVAIQGADAYNSILDQKITDKYIDKIKGFTVLGSLIETSSPQCQYCVKDLNRLITRDDFTEIKKRAIGLIDGTTFENLPTNKLHWGCRHSFVPRLT
jgi:hypothetical protein